MIANKFILLKFYIRRQGRYVKRYNSQQMSMISKKMGIARPTDKKYVKT
jgi:hypothetical protein